MSVCTSHPGKVPFNSQRHAKSSATGIANRTGARRMRVYQCRDCGKWFLSAAERKGAQRARSR